jgi:hypothetical protein
MHAVTPTTYHECTQLVQKILLLTWIKVTWRSQQTAYIHSMELVWPRALMVRSWCDRVYNVTLRSWCDRIKLWYGVDVTAYFHGMELMWFVMRLVWFRKVTLGGFCVHCTLYSRIHLADFMFLSICDNKTKTGSFIQNTTFSVSLKCKEPHFSTNKQYLVGFLYI